MAIERVAPGQVRFNLPGLTADTRGVVAGRRLALRFAGLDRLVSFLRLLSAGQSLDDLGGLEIVEGRAEGGPREMMVFVALAAGGGGLGDVVARAARAAGGRAYTGSERHFVPVRDARSPLGWDVVALSRDEGDVLFYGEEGVTVVRLGDRLPLDRLLLRLEVRRDHGAPTTSDHRMLVLARRGLGPVLAGHLLRSGADASAAQIEAGADSAFRIGRSAWLFRIESLPARLLPLVTSTPGLTSYRPVTASVAVETGFRHPVHLASCRQAFESDALILFARPPEAPTVIRPMPDFVGLGDVVGVSLGTGDGKEPVRALARRPKPLSLPIRVSPVPGRGGATAALVPWPAVDWVRRLAYALPEAALRGWRTAILDDGLLVVGQDDLSGFPFGVLLTEVAPGVLVPVGRSLRPAVSPALLLERAKLEDGDVLLFGASDAAPRRIAAADLEPFEVAALADLEAEMAEVRALAGSTALSPIEIRQEDAGPSLPLWGGRR